MRKRIGYVSSLDLCGNLRSSWFRSFSLDISSLHLLLRWNSCHRWKRREGKILRFQCVLEIERNVSKECSTIVSLVNRRTNSRRRRSSSSLTEMSSDNLHRKTGPILEGNPTIRSEKKEILHEPKDCLWTRYRAKWHFLNRRRRRRSSSSHEQRHTVPKIDFQLMRIEISEVIAQIFVQEIRDDLFQDHLSSWLDSTGCICKKDSHVRDTWPSTLPPFVSEEKKCAAKVSLSTWIYLRSDGERTNERTNGHVIRPTAGVKE